MTAHVVDFAALPAIRHHINGLAMIFHIQPVPNLHAVTIDWQPLMMFDIVDHQRNQLLRELIGTIVVRAPGDIHRHPIGIMKCHDKMIRACLRGGVRTMRRQRRGLGKVSFRSQCAIHLICGNLKVLLPCFPSFRLCIIPSLFSTLQQIDRPHYISLYEDLRIRDTTIHMTLRREVDDIIEIILGKQVFHQYFVTDISLYEDMARIFLHILQVFQIARVSQLVQIHQSNIRIFIQHVIDKVRADKTGTSCDQIGFHGSFSP